MKAISATIRKRVSPPLRRTPLVSMDWVAWKITITETNDVTIDCNIVVAYGTSVVTVASAVQEAAAAAVEAMTGIKPAAINVNVAGIVRP